MSLNEKQYIEEVTNNIKIFLNDFYHSQTGEVVDAENIESIIKQEQRRGEF